jgi:hypothetical protein
MNMHRFFVWALCLAISAIIGSSELRAESPVTFSGYLRIRAYATGGYFPPAGGEDKASDRLLLTRFRVSLVFKPNENVEVRWRFHAPHNTRWGTDASTQYGVRTMYAFGILKTDCGKFSIGRISSDIDSAGLQTLGYLPTWGMGSQAYIFDHDSERDGMIYRNDWDNGFGLKVFYSKMNSYSSNANYSPKDADYDRYSVEPYYKWETGGVSLALQYDRNNYSSTAILTDDPVKNYSFSLNPAFTQKWVLQEKLALALHAEAKYSNGKYKNPVPVNAESHRQDGFGAYVDLALEYAKGAATLGGWYFDGNGQRQASATANPTTDGTRRHDLVQPGEGFYPFVVFYLNHTAPARRLATFGGKESPNHWAVALMGNHKITDNITLNYGVADFRRSRGVQLVDGSQVSKHLGTEFDLGIVIKFLDNVQFSSKVGVFSSGPYYSQFYNNDVYDGNVWAWGNEIIFNF